jgi:hypothetical protein
MCLITLRVIPMQYILHIRLCLLLADSRLFQQQPAMLDQLRFQIDSKEADFIVKVLAAL